MAALPYVKCFMRRGNAGPQRFLDAMEAVCETRFPVPIDSPPLCFKCKGGFCTFQIKDGITKRTLSKTRVESPPINYDKVIEINGRSIAGDVDENVSAKLMRISDFVAQTVSSRYSCMVTELHLRFGLVGNKLYLLEDCAISTVPADPDFFGGETEQKEEEEDESEIEEVNDRAEIKREIEDRIEFEIHNFPRSKKVCCTNTGGCGPPRYKVKKIVVLLFRLQSKYPNIGDRDLWYLILRHMRNPEQEVVCCVQCYHCYHAADVIRLCAEMPQLSFELPARPFQPLVPAERAVMKKMPIGAMAKESYQPHSYVLNIVHSPYNDTSFHGLVPLPPPNRRSRGVKTATPGWAKRLSKDKESVLRTKTAKPKKRTKVVDQDPGWEMYAMAPAAKLPTFQPAKQSHTFAEFCYAECPFNYRIFERKRTMRKPGRLLARK